MVEGRKQLNLPDDVASILDDFAQRYVPGVTLKYPDTIRMMAAKLDPKKYGKK